MKKAGKVIGPNRAVVSRHGKVLTGKGTSGQGQPVTFTVVYDKQ
jgi:hypothetical protein